MNTAPRIVFEGHTPQPYGGKSAELKGQPYLMISNTSNYAWVYDDSGTGAHMDGTVFCPTPSDSDFIILGHMAQAGYGPALNTSVTVRAINEDPNNPLLKAPVDYSEIWNDHGTGGDHDGSFWQPIAPDGYVAIGAVAVLGYDKPNIGNYRCVRRDLVQETNFGVLIWNDQGSGGNKDLELYTIVGASGTFLAQPDYDTPRGTYYRLKV